MLAVDDRDSERDSEEELVGSFDGAVVCEHEGEPDADLEDEVEGKGVLEFVGVGLCEDEEVGVRD